MSTNPSEGPPEFPPSAPVKSTKKASSNGDRKEVFRVLVLMQDLGETVETSRARVTAQFHITHEELADIEREGIAMSWPPL